MNCKTLSAITHVYGKNQVVDEIGSWLGKQCPKFARQFFLNRVLEEIPQHVRITVHEDERLLRAEIHNFIRQVDKAKVTMSEKILLVQKLGEILGIQNLWANIDWKNLPGTD